MRLGVHCSTHSVGVAVFDRGAVRCEFGLVPAGEDARSYAESVLSALASHGEITERPEKVRSITFELSELLSADTTSRVHLIRVSPRPPKYGPDPLPLPLYGTSAGRHTPLITYLPGGHNAYGEEIVPLQPEPVLNAQLDPGPNPRFVVSAVGSLINSAHELSVGTALLNRFPEAHVEFGHSFHHTSFAVRERSALTNLTLRPSAEALVTALSVAASARFKNARLLVATNSGGSIPLARFAVMPVHSVSSLPATQAVGASNHLQVPEGTLTYSAGEETYSCEFSAGLPAVVPTLHSNTYGKLATPSCNVRLISDSDQADCTVKCKEGPSSTNSPASLSAIGGVFLPRVEWLVALTQVTNERDMLQARKVAESSVHARLVASGMPPESIRTVESFVAATSYSNPGVISLRIRAVADLDSPYLRGRQLP